MLQPMSFFCVRMTVSSTVRWSVGARARILSRLRRPAFFVHLGRGDGGLATADTRHLCLNAATPAAHLVEIDQHLAAVLVAHAGYAGGLPLQRRNELPATIELVEQVGACCCMGAAAC